MKQRIFLAPCVVALALCLDGVLHYCSAHEGPVLPLAPNERKNFVEQIRTHHVSVRNGSGVLIMLPNNMVGVVTGYHVVANVGTRRLHAELPIVFHDKRKIFASVRFTDPERDLAVIELNETFSSRYRKFIAPIGNAEAVYVSQPIAVMGNPFDYKDTFVTGIISAIRSILEYGPLMNIAPTGNEKIFQVDVHVHPGNSGGGLYNYNGQLLGIVVGSFFTQAEARSEDITFVVPINELYKFLHEKYSDEKKPKKEKPWLGIQVEPISFDEFRTLDQTLKECVTENSLLIKKVFNDSPASKGKLEFMDIICAIGEEIFLKDPLAFSFEIAKRKPGDTITLKIAREKSLLDISIRLGVALQGSPSVEIKPSR